MHSHPDHGHGHAHHFNTHSRAFALGVTLNLAFVAIEADPAGLPSRLRLPGIKDKRLR